MKIIKTRSLKTDIICVMSLPIFLNTALRNWVHNGMKIAKKTPQL
ncbi:hypothetical protein CNEO4_830031 [Clostridium neonatale]|nr:hypothetical protein CNEO4_830031 [Clostridium neonatale]